MADPLTDGSPLAHGLLMEELAELSLRLDGEELASEAESAGSSAASEAEDVRALLLKAGKDYRQRHLRAAAAAYRQRVRELGTRWVDLPEKASERRALLARVLARHPAVEQALLTVQYRDFRELTDRDVESLLVSLADLGVL